MPESTQNNQQANDESLDFNGVLAQYTSIVGHTFNSFAYQGDREELKKKMLDAIAGNRPSITDDEIGLTTLPNDALY